jgi:ubiquinone/menaquinone biosynthesis C-methylase UbiE
MNSAFGGLRLISIKIYLWLAELLYGPFAWAYDAVAWLVSFGYWSQWRRDALEFVKAGRILEVGFGTGELLIEMCNQKYDVIGLELSPQMQEVTSRKLQRLGLQVKRVRANTQAIPFLSGEFSTVISTFPSNYIAREDTMKEFHRVLVGGGRVVIIGIAAEFKSGWKKYFTKAILSNRNQSLIEAFLKKAQEIGFSTELKEKLEDNYRLLVLLLRKEDA